MNNLITHTRGENWTTSTIVAKELNRNHQHVLEKIRKLLGDLDDLAVENLAVKKAKVKFVFEDYTSRNGRIYEQCKMNRPAFSLLIMQMSGKKAFKTQYLFNNAFYEMEQYILKKQNTEFIAAREQGKLARGEVTHAIQNLVNHAIKQGSVNAKRYYATITKETYKALGYLAKGEKVGSEFRNHLDHFQLAELFIAETLASQVIEEGIAESLHYKEIYILAKQRVCDFGKSQLKFKPHEKGSLDNEGA